MSSKRKPEPPENVADAGRKKGKTIVLDSDLEDLCDTLDLSPKSRRFLAEQFITDVSALLNKRAELGRACLPNVNKGTQMQLYKFCLWYYDFLKKNGGDADWKEHFEEDTLSKFDEEQLKNAASDDSDGALEEDLENACNEMEVTKQSRLQLAKVGITTVKDLLARKTDLELFSLRGIKKILQMTFLKLCLWIEDFYHKNDSKEEWQAHFSGDVLADFQQEPSLERDYRMALERIHEGRGDGGITHVSDETFEYAATITTRYLSRQLVRQCQEKFKPYDVAFKCIKALMHPIGKPHETIHVVSGKTQSGKSTVKAVCAAVHRQLSCLLIIITKGVPERDDLKVKLNKLLGGCRETMDAGLLVIADTGGQIAKATKAVQELRRELPHARFGVIVDECDAMYRTANAAQIMEQRFTDLMELSPSFRMEISATIFSALVCLNEQGKQVELMEILTTQDYSGISEMERFRNRDGCVVSLSAKDITSQHGVKYMEEAYQQSVELFKEEVRTKPPVKVLFSDDCELNPKCASCQSGGGCEMHSDIPSARWYVNKTQRFIPYTSEAMLQLFDKRLKAKKKGELILVATNPRVYAANNVIVQAASIQNHYRSQGSDMAVLVAFGRGMEVRLPGYAKGRFIRRRLKTISEVIEQVDKIVGLETPIAIFGYSRMCRCVSFRTSSRVPTAMILSRGPGYSLEDFIQALGRATFNGLSVLRDNGHDKVTILTNHDDFTSARKYYVFVEAINSILSNNPEINIMEAFRGAAKKFPDEANFIRHTNRKIGRRKDLKEKVPFREQFEEPLNFDESEGKRQNYWGNLVVQRIFTLFSEMADGNHGFRCSTEDLTDAYNSSYLQGEGDEPAKKGEIQKVMMDLKRDVLFVNEKCGDSGKVVWSAKNLAEIKHLTNEEIGEEDGVEEDGFPC